MTNFAIRTALAATAGMMAVPAAAADGNPATNDGTGQVIVLSPISFITIEDIDFGTVILPSSGNGTLALDAGGAAPVYTNLDYVTSLAATPQRGRFVGSGTANQTVVITTTLPTILEQFPGGPSVPVALNLDRAAEPDGSYIYTVDPTSLTFEVGVGGTLTVPSTAQVGSYSATFSVTATYQ